MNQPLKIRFSNNLNVFRAVFIIRVKAGLQYRASALAGMSTQFFWGFMNIMIFSAFIQSSGQTDISMNGVASYVWLNQAFLYMIAIYFVNAEISDMIRTGDIAYELTRPQDLYSFWFAKLIGQRVSGAALRFPFVLILASILPSAYRFPPPAGVSELLLFTIAMLLGMVIVVSYMLFTYFIQFYIVSSDGVLWAFNIVGLFFAGQIVPLMFMPERIQNILYLFPFAYASDFPFRVYSGGYDTAFVARGILVQFVWAAALTVTGRAMLTNAVKKTVAQGG